MPRNAALPTASTIGLRSGCDKRKCVPTKVTADPAIGPRPSTLVQLPDQCHRSRGTASGMAKDTSPSPHDVSFLDRERPDHSIAVGAEMKSHPFRCLSGRSPHEGRVVPQVVEHELITCTRPLAAHQPCPAAVDPVCENLRAYRPSILPLLAAARLARLDRAASLCLVPSHKVSHVDQRE